LEKSIMRVENQGEGLGWGGESEWRGADGAASWARRERRGKKEGAKKRPSVETEGRLTIACHMKNLQKIDVMMPGYFLLHYPFPAPTTQR
jgi:hypothetical protein